MESIHFGDQGNAPVVDVGDKAEAKREAMARDSIFMSSEHPERAARGTMIRGDVLGATRVAGIMGAKKTSSLIPPCHILDLTELIVDLTIKKESNGIEAVYTTRIAGKTGAEMETLTGVSAVLLTTYDICKTMDKSMEIGDAYLEHKGGGKNGEFHNPRCTRDRG